MHKETFSFLYNEERLAVVYSCSIRGFSLVPRCSPSRIPSPHESNPVLLPLPTDGSSASESCEWCALGESPASLCSASGVSGASGASARSGASGVSGARYCYRRRAHPHRPHAPHAPYRPRVRRRAHHHRPHARAHTNTTPDA